MAPGRKRLSKIQFGKETVSGTAVAATTVWRGMGSMISDDRTLEEIEEMSGIFEGPDRTNITAYKSTLDLASTPLTFEQYQYLWAMALAGPTTGAADGPGTDKIYATTLPTTSIATPISYTIKAGDDFEVEQFAYSVCTKIGMEFVAGKTAMMSGGLVGRQTATSTFTGAIALPTVEDVLGSKFTVFLDDVSGTYGTTQVSQAILAGKLAFDFTWEPKYTADGSLDYSYIMLTGMKATGELTYEHNTAVSGSGGAKQFYRNQTAKLLQLKAVGSAVATPGTTYSNKTILHNLPIKFTKIGVLADQNGNDIVTMSFRSRYNITKGDAGQIIVVNENTTLT
jgi:hypothetical protein